MTKPQGDRERAGGAKRFEDLWIWQEARVLARQTYEDFGDESRARRDFEFRRQVQRAAISVMSNIAEGFERATIPDTCRFLDIARGSCGEVRSLYTIAEDLGYVPSEVAELRRDETRRLSAAITSFKSSLRKR